jgi:mannose-6-phosphate isomerase
MPHLVRGALKEYDWGVVNGLAAWHGPTGGPQAELWFGVHPSGPTIVTEGPDAGRLLAELPQHAGMPLVKLLAAALPLSLQVHPDAELARRGWESGSPLYADGCEKSEMLVALKPFDVHAGWRDSDSAARVLDGAGVPRDIIAQVREGEHAAAIRALLALDAATCSAATARVVESARAQGWNDAALAALEQVRTAHPADAGVLVTVLLQHDVLLPGEAMSVSAGVVHSYVSGLGVEVMTSSDNVLRLGLTSKPVGLEDALSAIREDLRPVRMTPTADGSLTPTEMPFDVVLARAPMQVPAGRHRLVLALEGATRVEGGGTPQTQVAPGWAMVWAPEEGYVEVVPGELSVIVTSAPAVNSGPA